MGVLVTPIFSGIVNSALAEALMAAHHETGTPISFVMAEPDLRIPRGDVSAALRGAFAGAKLFSPPEEISRRALLELSGGASHEDTPIPDRLPLDSGMQQRIGAVIARLALSGQPVSVADELEAIGRDPAFDTRPDFRARCFQAAFAKLWEDKLCGKAVDEEQMERLRNELGRLPTLLISSEMPALPVQSHSALQAAGVSQHALAALAPPPRLIGLDPARFGLKVKSEPGLSSSMDAINVLDIELAGYPLAGEMPGLISPNGELLLAVPQSKEGGKFQMISFDSGITETRFMAAGGMGLLFVVKQRDPMATAEDVPALPVVAKTLRIEFAGDPRIRRRFLLEEWVGSLLRHRNILTVLRLAWTQDGRPVIFMPYQRGWSANPAIKDLGELLKVGPLDIDFAIESVFLPVSDALAHAHEQGVLHRDIKPANIFIDREGNRPVFKLGDWGVAYLVGHPNYDQPGTAPGTPGYMSRKAQSGGNTGASSDVFALAVSMYYALTGKHPVDTTPYKDLPGAELARLPAMNWLKEVQSMRLTRTNIPMDLERIILRGMGYTPQEQTRFGLGLDANAQPIQTAQDFHAALYSWLASHRAKKDAANDVAAARALGTEAGKLRVEAMGFAPFDAWRRKMEQAIACYDLALDKLKGHDKEVEKERWELLWKLFEAAEIFGLEDQYEPRLTLHPLYSQRAQEQGRLLVGVANINQRGVAADIVTYKNEDGVFVERLLERFDGLDAIPKTLPKGVYALRLRGKDIAEMQIPFLIRRGEITELKFNVHPKNEVPEGFAVVPAGEVITDESPFFYGSKPKTVTPIPQDLLVKKTLVTNAEYIAFLNDLISLGGYEESLGRLPRDGRGNYLWHKETVKAVRDGEFIPETVYFAKENSDERDEPIIMDGPVIWISAEDARAWTSWFSTKQNTFELPSREEILYLIRGGKDARRRPWGDAVLPEGAANVKRTVFKPTKRQEEVRISSVRTYPLDASPFGYPYDIWGNALKFTRDPVVMEDGRLNYFFMGSGFNQDEDRNPVKSSPFFHKSPGPIGFFVVARLPS